MYDRFLKRMRAGEILVLDGAMGTELIRRGIPIPEPLWSAAANLENPAAVLNIHQEYVASGAQIITTNTFRTTPRSYRRAGYSQPEETAWRSLGSAVTLAKQAAGDECLVAGSIAPLEDCYQPQDFPGAATAAEEFGVIANRLVDAGVDFLLLETMGNCREVEAVLRATAFLGVPCWLSFITTDGKHLLDGTPLRKAVELACRFDIDVLLLNCSLLSNILIGVDEVARHWPGLWGAYPNLGVDMPSSDGVFEDVISESEFITGMKQLLDRGASVLGACCGSGPGHIRLINSIL